MTARVRQVRSAAYRSALAGYFGPESGNISLSEVLSAHASLTDEEKEIEWKKLARLSIQINARRGAWK